MIKSYNGETYIIPKEFEEEVRKDALKKFAEKIKYHMMMYCQSRIEQQYCALEVIDYIGKLMGEKDFSIDVEKEIKEHDERIRAKTIDEFVEYLKEYMWWSTQADENVIGEFALEEYAIAFKDMLRRKTE